MKIVILGGLGFIGKNLYEVYKEFRKDDDKIYLVDVDNLVSLVYAPDFLNSESYDKDNIFICDLCEYDRFEEWMDEICKDGEIDILYNLAATVGVKEVSEDPLRAYRNNTKITENIVRYFKNKEKLPVIIQASSSEVYGNSLAITEGFDFQIDTTKPQTLYAISKIANEAMLASLKEKTQIVIVRYFNVSGRYQKRGVMFEILSDLMKNNSCKVNSRAFRNFMNAEAAAYATYLIAHNTEMLQNRVQLFNIGSLQVENYMSIRELSTIIKDALKLTNIKIEEIDNPEVHWIPSRNVFPIGLEKFIRDLGKEDEFYKRDITVKEIVQKMLPNII